MRKFRLVLAVFMVAILCSFMMQPKLWDIPTEYRTMKNPVKKTDKVMSEGKLHYIQLCAGCHGLTGKGDGDKVKNLVNVKPSSLVLDNVARETDGEHFYKIKFGRGNIHSFRGKLDDDAIWMVVHYMKSLYTK